MSSEVIVETALPAQAIETKGKVKKKGGKRIGYNYIILKSLKESPKNDVVKCIYIKSLTNFGICVIKEGTAGDVKDQDGRDIKDRLIWQKEMHELLQDKVRIPKLIGSFEENGNYYLAIEHIKGKTLGALFREHYGKGLRECVLKGNKLGMRFLDYMLRIINLLDTLHQNHVVHRDVTSANFIITPKGKVALIDMELSYYLKKEMPPFQLGTYGYMSPEQLTVSTPTIKEDVFSVGAILLQLWTGIIPNKLTQAPFEELKNKVNFFIPDQAIADIVTQCLNPEAGERPLLKDVYTVIKQYRLDLKKRVRRKNSETLLYDKKYIEEVIQETLKTFASSLLADRERGWFAESQSPEAKEEKGKISKGWYASFHIGSSGVLYLLSKAHLVGLDIEIYRPPIHQALSLIEEKYIKHIDDAPPGLHFGADGIAACLAEAIGNGVIEPTDKHLSWINSLLSRKTQSLNIISGVAGQGIANLIIKPIIGIEDIDARLHEYVNHLLENQHKNGSWARGFDNNGKSRITRGFANGIAGIIRFLLEYAEQYNNIQSIEGAERGLQWLMNNAIKSKGHIEWFSSMGKEVAPWWSDGGPGISLAFMKAYALLKNPSYKEFSTGALHAHSAKVVGSNLSQNNGLSGLGEIYLEAYELLHDDQWLERAGWIAQTIIRLKKHHAKYGPYWLVEDEKQPIPGFMVGSAGVIHFLLRYCHPDKISFPMMPSHAGARKSENFNPLPYSQSMVNFS